MVWYRKGAEQGYAGAQNDLGVMYKTGLGVAQHRVKAYALFNLSAAADASEEAVNNRKVLLEQMSNAEIEAGQRLSQAMSKQGNFLKALDD